MNSQISITDNIETEIIFNRNDNRHRNMYKMTTWRRVFKSNEMTIIRMKVEKE